MDLGRAFAYVFDDDEWAKKILIGGLISLVPILGNCIVYGYMDEVARRVYAAPATRDMPEWDDIGGYLARGFFFWLGLVIWALPFILAFTCALIGVIGLGVASGEDAAVAAAVLFFYCIFFPALFVFTLATGLVVPLLLGRYAIHRRFGALFEFSEIIADVRRIGAIPLVILVVTYVVASYIGQLGFVLCFIGVIFTGFYGNVVIAHAAGQIYRPAGALEAQTSGSI